MVKKTAFSRSLVTIRKPEISQTEIHQCFLFPFSGFRFHLSSFPRKPVLIDVDVQLILGRNALRGFPIHQVDLTLRRRFQVTERLGVRFGADVFNIFNHPNFADPNNLLTSATFGLSPSMLGRALGGGGSLGGLNPLYQIGGPRSIQLFLKVEF